MRRYALEAILTALLTSGSGEASAEPLTFTTALPLDDPTLAKIAADGAERRRAEQLLGMLSFYPDTTNQPDSERDPSARKIYYAAPFFRVAPELELSGQLVLERGLLDAIDSIDRLAGRISSGLPDDELRAAISDVMATAAIAVRRSGQADAIEVAERFEAQARRYRRRGAIRRLDDPRREFPGRRAEPTEPAPGGVVPMLTEYRGLLAAMTLGYVTVVFDAGYTSEERDILGRYRAARPDVEIRALPVRAVGVRALAQTGAGTPSPTSSIVMIRDVRAGSTGLCESMTRCSVTLTFTEVGTRAAANSMVGATVLPIGFWGALEGPSSPHAQPAPCARFGPHQSLVERILSNAHRVNFDGFPLACWKRAGESPPYLVACPDDGAGKRDYDMQIGAEEKLVAQMVDLCLDRNAGALEMR